MGFRLVPKLVTLNDAEQRMDVILCYFMNLPTFGAH